MERLRRRNFLKAVPAALAAIRVPALAALPATNGKLKITAVESWRLEGHRPGSNAVNHSRFSAPFHIYDELRPGLLLDTPALDGKPIPTTFYYLKIRTDAGVDGFYGPVSETTCRNVEQQFKPFLLGKDPLAGETLWDELYRQQPHSQGSYFMALSIVDNALWDLRGHYFQVPVYRLLGGPTRPAVEAYASCIDLSMEPEELPKLALYYKEQGFRFSKWFLAHGPADGPEGMQKNVAAVRTLRETLGEDMEFMLDCWMSFDLHYATEFAQQIERYRPGWMEEPFLANEMQSFVELRKRTRIPIATGEHFYGRWTAGDYLRAGALDVVQTDPDWCGGISELVKICAIASQYGVQVIPHCDCLHPALHVIASQSPHVCPMIEYMVDRLYAGWWKYYFEKDPLLPVRGKIALRERPGFGIELDPARIEKQTLVNWT